MNSTDKPNKRNTGSLIVKCVVILVVLGVICSISIWSWFTQNKTALADGIFVKSKGDGVQVSWDGVNYYDNLQALKQEDVSGDANGLALNISGKDGEPAPLSLVTGNGLQFFEPSLNRRLGTVLTNADGSWYGTDITSANSQGRYIDIDLYFRSENPRDVFLAGDSRISPKSTDDRISEYGVFSKDNIASATRLAFLNDEKNDCAFIWAPNADNELEQNDAGYKKYTTTDNSVTVTYYPLENNVNCALVNPLSASAVSKGNNFNKGVSFIDSAKNNVSPVSITLEEQFTTVKDGTGYEATYKFKSNSNNTYLTLTNGVVSYTAAGSNFTLEYKDGVEGPLLKSGDYYLVFEQGKLKGVKADALNTAFAVTVYIGTTYKFNTGLTEDKQLYQFYNNSTKQLETLSSATSPKLFTSTNSDTEETKVCSTKITTLEKSAGSDYYTAHVVMRVWVEGTDREAKTPLADGIFDISLHFTSQ